MTVFSFLKLSCFLAALGILIMLNRYSRPEMAKIWSEENKYRAWLEVEILADEAWAELGEIPKEDVAKIRENASFDINRILEIEEETRHDVVAFTRAVSETLGEERKWVLWLDIDRRGGYGLWLSLQAS